ncbi:uncharacterized protein LOC125187897 [Salvia hispanica]|uniref:uncharacterized protein LOC125187897 n=1 Tax=Salvia hispanica TaxID=49212 RepID=UPI0020093FB1|nr:uncharacterized protein LOC125187897 [Salvia hispanica]
MEDPHPPPRILPPSRSGSGRRSCGDANSSPEFEFWMVRNPSLPPPNLLSADELFSGGVLLPLHNLNLAPPREADADRDPEPEPESESSAAELTANSSALTSSKRWRDIFRKSEKKSGEEAQSVKEKENRRREKKNGGGGASAAELNINIWPFSRSRSAGNGGNRPRAAAIRKVSSAPCSRSNSRGESKSRKPPTSPGRGGVHLGRSSPVWQVRRGGEKKRSEGIENRRRVPIAGGAKARVLSLNVPVCMGYRQHFSCKSDEITVGGGGGAVAGGEGTRGSGSNLFNIRSIFTKKVY